MNIRIVQQGEYPEGEILKLIQEVLPPAMAQDYSLNEIGEKLGNPQCIHVIAEDKGEVISYLRSVPFSIAAEELMEKGNHDVGFDERSMYIDTFVSLSHQITCLKIIRCFLKEAFNRDKEVIGLHARMSNGFANVVAQLFPVEHIATHKNFLGYGDNEPFAYFEGRLRDVKWLMR